MDEVDQVPQIAADAVKLQATKVSPFKAFQTCVQPRPVIAFAGSVILVEVVG